MTSRHLTAEWSAMPWIILFYLLATYAYLELEEFGLSCLLIGGTSLLLSSILAQSSRPGLHKLARAICGLTAAFVTFDALREIESSCNIRLSLATLSLMALTIAVHDAESKLGRVLVRTCLVLASILGVLTGANVVVKRFRPADPYRIEPTPESATEESMILDRTGLLKWQFAKNFKGHFCHPDYNHEYFETNADGFRDRSWPTKPNPDVIRVLVLGDSIAVGLGVERMENYASLLESKLTQKFERRVEVFNGAVSGYGPGEQLLIYNNLVDRLAPHLVLALFYDGNDLEDMRFLFYRARFLRLHEVYLKSEEQAAISAARGERPADWTENQSPVYRFASRTHIGNLILQRGEQLLSRWNLMAVRGPVNSLLLDSLLDPPRQEIEELMHFSALTYSRLSLECLKHGAKLFVVRIPAMVQSSDAILDRTLDLFGIGDRKRFNRQRPGRALIESLTKSGVPSVDCLVPFEREPRPDSLYFPEGHLSRLGHVKVAEAIAATIDRTTLETRR